ncbi:MAG TPA: hypothetical protein VIJ14_05905, partial [Rhabdochlamydiaceae bacterium]
MAVASVRDSLVLLRQSVGNFIGAQVEQQKGVEPNIHLEAARDVSLGIENALVAYDYPGVLSVPADKVTAAVSGQLKQLQEIVTLLEAKNNREVLGLYSRVQQLIFSLGLRSWQPRLTGTWPRQVYVVNNGFEVSFAGLFQDAVAYKAACLVVGEDRFELKNGTSANDRLYFAVKLRPGYIPDTALNNCHVIKATLEVDYLMHRMLSFARKAKYEVSIGMQPLLACNATVKYSKKEVVREDKRPQQSATFTISREKLKVEGPIVNHFRVGPTPGWKISGTPIILIGEAASDVPQDKYTDDYINIELNLPADQQKIEAHAEFVESQPVIEEREFSQTVPLKWGVPFDFESPTFNITIKPLDGPEVVLT